MVTDRNNESNRFIEPSIYSTSIPSRERRMQVFKGKWETLVILPVGSFQFHIPLNLALAADSLGSGIMVFIHEFLF